MSTPLLLGVILTYFGVLLFVAWWTSRKADNESFFIGNRSSPWMLVAFGMIGTSLSGVTFISVPGAVGSTGWGYLQIVLGQTVGYAVIALVLLPLYYRLRLTSIYGYLAQRLGDSAYRTGAAFFIVSRTLGATARLYIVVRVLQDMVFAPMGLPFWLTTSVILLMILLYTVEGGVRTIVWTDTLQTTGMLLGLVLCSAYLLSDLGLDLAGAWSAMNAQGLSNVWVTDPMSRGFAVKQFVAGVFIAIAMTGLDQEMMQKNLSVRTLRDAQKNMAVMSLIMLGVVLLFLFLGGLLHLVAGPLGVKAQGDGLFPAVVLQHLPVWVQIVFVLGLISALFPSADGALTALTSSTCLDLLRLNERAQWDEARRARVRRTVHLAYAGLFLLLVLVFRWVDNPSMIGLILKIAGYTYGPLLGLFAFGVLTRRTLCEGAAPWVAVAAPLLCLVLDANHKAWLGGYEIGLEMLLINGTLTFVGLWLCSRPSGAEGNAERMPASPASTAH